MILKMMTHQLILTIIILHSQSYISDVIDQQTKKQKNLKLDFVFRNEIPTGRG